MSSGSSTTAGRPRVLIIIQNLPIPFDRRVWLECQALTRAGYEVTVVCPKGKNDPGFAMIDGVAAWKYKPYAPGGSKASFVLEYLYSFLFTAFLVLRARVRGGRFQAMQACNPPDIFWPIAWALRLVDRTRFVFDHHDLCPELYDSRFPNGNQAPKKGLLALEKATFRTADRVISTNASYADVAVRRGGKRPEHVTVVRTGPDPVKMHRGPAVHARLRGREHLVTYIGVMGPQDGVDVAVRAAGYIVKDLGRTDISFTFMGGGDSYEELVALRDQLGITDYVELPGRVPDDYVQEVMSTADLGLSPDPKNPLNDVSTMNKTLEYMAFGLPVVAFDLKETRVSAGDASIYVPDNGVPDESVAEYAKAIVRLLDDEASRVVMGAEGRRRIEEELGWPHQALTYVQVYDAMLGRPLTQKSAVVLPTVTGAKSSSARPPRGS